MSGLPIDAKSAKRKECDGGATMSKLPIDAKNANTAEEWVALNDELATTKAALVVFKKERDTLKEELDVLKAHPALKAALEEETRVKELIAAGLHAASEKGCVEAVKELIATGSDMNLVRPGDDNGWAPLHLAIKYGHFDVVDLLIAAKADVNQATTHGETPIDVAFDQGHFKLVKELLDLGCKSAQDTDYQQFLWDNREDY